MNNIDINIDIKAFLFAFGLIYLAYSCYQMFIYKHFKEAKEKAVTQEVKDKLDIEARLFRWYSIFIFFLFLFYIIIFFLFRAQLSKFFNDSWVKWFLFYFPLIVVSLSGSVFWELRIWIDFYVFHWLANYLYCKKTKKQKQKEIKNANKNNN